VANRDKLFWAICNNPKDVRFADACKAAEYLGFTAKPKTGSSHHPFARPGEITQLNFQKVSGGKIKPYQGRQLVQMIEKFWDFENGRLKQ
jgi:hypothetical protein